MKFQLLFIIAIAAAVFYEGYLKGPLLTVYHYGQVAAGGLVLAYMVYTFYKQPASFFTTLEFVQGHLLHSDGATYKQLDRILEGKPKLARQVSPLLKKKIAAAQEWRCGHCKTLLDASYEVDHIVALYRGGSNSEDNLIALCRNCHGKKTVEERLKPYL
jgi:HNH endonuclease